MPVKGSSRLQFTEAEQDGGRLKEHDRAKEREADRAAARSRNTPPPKSRKKLKRRMIEQKNGAGKKKSGKIDTGQSTAKGESQLHFEENRPKPPSKLSHAARSAPGLMVSSQLHRQISEAEDENVGVESAHRLEQTAEGGAYLAAHSHRARQLRQYRAAERAEVDALYRQSLRDHPELGSNPLSRWQQKQAIKRQYAEARRASQRAEGTLKTAAERISDTLRGAAEQSRKAGGFIVRHKRGFLIVLALFFMVVLLLNTMSSCSVLAEALLGAGGGSTYPSRDEDMLGAEASYAALEADLQYEVDHYAELHPGYDEYRFDLDEIKHDPYVLTSFLTAYHQGEWTLSEVQSTLQMLFDRQYTLTETVTTETRYRTETRTREDGTTYTVDVPYTYCICNVKLENADLSHLPVEFLDEDRLHMYATYMATYGNRPDPFLTPI